ncbi:MAG: hypothetical protein H7Y59_00920 [Anaerolineales bacterium]|nr:hypothetical protein [Anaerolineales bacterium]
MKKISKILIPMLVLATLLVSACAGAVAPVDTAGGSKVKAAPIQFTGVIEVMDGNKWTVGGQVITVSPSLTGDGPFNLGDTIKVEVEVQEDGSLVVTRVEASATDDNSNDANSNDANSNDVNSNDDNSNDVNSNDDNSNDDNGNDDNSNDDNGNDDTSNDDDSNDDNGNDDNSGGGGDDDNSNDD